MVTKAALYMSNTGISHPLKERLPPGLSPLHHARRRTRIRITGVTPPLPYQRYAEVFLQYDRDAFERAVIHYLLSYFYATPIRERKLVFDIATYIAAADSYYAFFMPFATPPLITYYATANRR